MQKHKHSKVKHFAAGAALALLVVASAPAGAQYFADVMGGGMPPMNDGGANMPQQQQTQPQTQNQPAQQQGIPPEGSSSQGSQNNPVAGGDNRAYTPGGEAGVNAGAGGAGAVPTIASCTASGMGWDAANSRCSRPTGDSGTNRPQMDQGQTGRTGQGQGQMGQGQGQMGQGQTGRTGQGQGQMGQGGQTGRTGQGQGQIGQGGQTGRTGQGQGQMGQGQQGQMGQGGYADQQGLDDQYGYADQQGLDDQYGYADQQDQEIRQVQPAKRATRAQPAQPARSTKNSREIIDPSFDEGEDMVAPISKPAQRATRAQPAQPARSTNSKEIIDPSFFKGGNNSTGDTFAPLTWDSFSGTPAGLETNLFDQSMFTKSGQKGKKIQVESALDKIDLEDEDYSADFKTLYNTLVKAAAMKSKEKAMNNILTILNTVSQICESADLTCDGQDELVQMVTDAYDDGKVSAKELKAIGKNAKAFLKDATKEYTDENE